VAARCVERTCGQIPTIVLVESLQARPGRGAQLNHFISTCLIEDSVPVTLARRAQVTPKPLGCRSAINTYGAAKDVGVCTSPVRRSEVLLILKRKSESVAPTSPPRPSRPGLPSARYVLPS
jgi:hypothetical protein